MFSIIKMLNIFLEKGYSILTQNYGKRNIFKKSLLFEIISAQWQNNHPVYGLANANDYCLLDRQLISSGKIVINFSLKRVRSVKRIYYVLLLYIIENRVAFCYKKSINCTNTKWIWDVYNFIFLLIYNSYSFFSIFFTVV